MEKIGINNELIRSLMTYLNAKGYAHNTITSYKLGLRRLLKDKEYLDKELVMKYLKKHKQPNQRAVVGIINQYCNQNNIDFNVVIPVIKQKPRKLPEILSIEEIKLMVKATPYPYNLMLRCLFGMGAGLRISEVIKLSWNNIRWVEWLANKEYGVAILKETKRDTERVVNIPNEIMEDLYTLAKERRILNEFGIPSGGQVFPIKVNQFRPELRKINFEKWRIQYVDQARHWFKHNIIKLCCSKALNKPIHSHMLRHSRATYLYEVEGLPIERIQQLLGHKDLKTTMIYTQVDPKSTFRMLKDTKVV